VSLATLQGGRFQQVRIGPIDHWKRAELKATVHTGKDSEGRKLRRVLTFSMLMQRELPPGAQIKEVAVVCRKRGGTQHYLPPGEQPHGRHRPRRSAPRVGDEYEWSVTFTCQTPDAATASASRSACGLNLGWRQTPQGLLIATLADSAGRLERTHLPGSILAGLDRAEALQGSLDTAANAMRARLAVWAREAGEDAPEAWREAAAAALRSESHEPLARLALAWKDWDYRPDWRGDGFRLDYRDAAATLESAQTLEAWRKADKLLRQEMEGARRRALNERRKFYEGLAGRLARDHAVIGLGQLDLKRAALRVVADVEENTLAESARRNRQRAGLYELTDWLKKQAAKHGSQVMTAERPVNTTCHATGQRFAPPKDAINYACPACGSHHDRDENAARVALADAAGAPRAVPDAPKPPRRSRFKRLDPEKEIGGTGSAVDSRGAA
ncbi:zinc ribbon domain-containing protein, partial [Methylomagnum sp.]